MTVPQLVLPGRGGRRAHLRRGRWHRWVSPPRPSPRGCRSWSGASGSCCSSASAGVRCCARRRPRSWPTPDGWWPTPATWLAGRRRCGTGRSGRLRVGMIDAVAVHHCAPALRAFRRAHAHLDLRLMVAPSGELLDAAGRWVCSTWPSWSSRRFATPHWISRPSSTSRWWWCRPRARRHRRWTTRERGDHGCCSRAARTPVAWPSRRSETVAPPSRWWPSRTSPRCCVRWPASAVGWTVLPEVQATLTGTTGSGRPASFRAHQPEAGRGPKGRPRRQPRRRCPGGVTGRSRRAATVACDE